MVETVSCLACSHKRHSVQKKTVMTSPLTSFRTEPVKLCFYAFRVFFRPLQARESLQLAVWDVCVCPRCTSAGRKYTSCFCMNLPDWKISWCKFLLPAVHSCLPTSLQDLTHILPAVVPYWPTCVLLLAIVGCSFVIFVSLEKHRHCNWFAFNKILTPEKPVSMVEITHRLHWGLHYSTCKKERKTKFSISKYQIQKTYVF